MTVDYQIVVNMMVSIFIIVFPIALIFCLGDKFIDIFLSFVSGKRVKL